MSIASEITNYANGLSDAYDAVSDMQGLIPQDKNMNNLDTAIRTIPQNQGANTTTFHWGGSPNYSMYKDSGYTTAAAYSDIAAAYADGLVYIADGEDETTYVMVSDIPDAYTITVTGVGLPDNKGGSTSYAYASSTWTKTATTFQNELTAGSNISIAGSTISATDTTYSDFTGATSGAAGAHGLVPAPAAGDQDKVLSGAGTWVAQSGGTTYTAGSHIDITSNVISAEGYIWGDDAAPASTPASTITSAMIVDGTIQATDIATGVVPIITMTDTDPGEGSPLAANNFVAVYGDDPSNMSYSLTEAKTGATWIDGSPIYKKTINFGALPNNTSKSVAHGIQNISQIVKIEGIMVNGSGSGWAIPYYSVRSVSVEGSNVVISTSIDLSSFTGYVTIYYTKSS